eukprot:Tbor_TRINITY_DN3823_c0_g1::TRINITY_DN3823_c0_g1_i1::g.5707::m.5707
MEKIAWRYVSCGDVISAEKLFNTLDSTFRSGPNLRSNFGKQCDFSSYGRNARLCRVVANPTIVPQPDRGHDAVEAFLDDRFPPVAFFRIAGEEAENYLQSSSVQESPAEEKIYDALTIDDLRERFRIWLITLHPDKNTHPSAQLAFQRLLDMKDKISQALGGEENLGLKLSDFSAFRKRRASDIKTQLPTVRNSMKMREQMKKPPQMDVLSNTNRSTSRKLNCSGIFSLDSVFQSTKNNSHNSWVMNNNSHKAQNNENTNTTDECYPCADSDDLNSTVIIDGVPSSPSSFKKAEGSKLTSVNVIKGYSGPKGQSPNTPRDYQRVYYPTIVNISPMVLSHITPHSPNKRRTQGPHHDIGSVRPVTPNDKGQLGCSVSNRSATPLLFPYKHKPIVVKRPSMLGK